jgi:hypothetical protein
VSAPGNNAGDRSEPALFALSNWLWIALVVGVTGAASYFGFGLERAGTLGFWVCVGAPTFALAAVAVVRARRDGELRGWLRFVWGDPTRGIVSAALLVIIALGVVHALAPAGSPRESWMARMYLQFGHPGILRDNAALVAAGVISITAAEEIVWRGFVTTLLAEKIGSRRAWIVAAVLYAVALAPTAWALRDPVAGLNPMPALAALGLGLAWGAMARATGRLVPGILSHAAFDWCVIMMFRLWGPSV